MAQTVYFAYTGPELEDLFYIVQKQALDAGMRLVRRDFIRGEPSSKIGDEIRQAITQADYFIAVIGYRHASAGHGPAIIEFEIDLALAANKPVAAFVPRPGGPLDTSLRRYTFGLPERARESHEELLERIRRRISFSHFEDAADLSQQITQVLMRWRAPEAEVLFNIDLPPAELMPEAEADDSRDRLKDSAPPAPPAVPAPSPSVPTVPGRSRERAEAEAQAAPPFDIDALAEAIAAKTAAHIRALQLEDQEEVARRAVEYAEALRMRPGDLIFGRPSDASQFKSDAFMIMPFNPAFDGVYRSVVQPLFAGMGLTVRRGDEFTSARGSIISEVWAALNACRFVIADITGGNDNVFYELGIAHTLNKPTLLITQAQTPEEVPFDLRHLRYIAYANTLAGADQLRADLKRAVEWLLNELRETWET